jgi:hypothetical protein
MKKSTAIASQIESNAFKIIEALYRHQHYIESHDPIQSGYRIRLGCGLVITMYRTQKILVQGTLKMKRPDLYLRQLIPLLPPHTNWQIPQVRYPGTAIFYASTGHQKGVNL